MQRTIELPEAQVRELEQLAAREQRSLDQVVQRALGDYLARRHQDWSDWGRRWDALVADVQARMPAGVTPEEIEAEITASFAEDRAERAADRRAEAGAADAGCR